MLTTKINDSSVLIANISSDYLNLSLANEYVDDVTISNKVIKYNQHFLHANEISVFKYNTIIST